MSNTTPRFTSFADLASARLGGRVLTANDEFFAPKSNLLKPEPPVFIPGKFTTRGKWMDGWETRRRRTPGHDWCVIKLGVRGIVRGVDVDTSFFTGNYPSHCSIDALDVSVTLTKETYGGAGGPWLTILPKSPLSGDRHNWFEVASASSISGAHLRASRSGGQAERAGPDAYTHVRLNIYPDGGIARLRVYGDVLVDWGHVGTRLIDLAEIRNGGLVLGASDMHFGAKDNMIMPGRAKNMGDGWETRRRRGPGHDWAIVRLGTSGSIKRIELDTNHFKGNYPDAASVEGILAPDATLDVLARSEWMELLPQTKLKAHFRHLFAQQLREVGPISHVRLNIYPDGGISRFRVYGIVASAGSR
jgi:allantoicase